MNAIPEVVEQRVEDAREELVELCARLVRAPSVNAPGNTQQVADIVHRYLQTYDVVSELVRADPMMPNVVASISGAAPGPHLVFNVHLDTMPPGDETAWTVPIFDLTREGGRLYGLGIGNMKGAVAAACLAMRVLADQRPRWCGRVTLAAVSDECVFGDNGAAFLLATRPQDVVGDVLICGEGPGFRRLGVAEKGVAWFRLEAQGDSGHASGAAPGTSAISRLASAVLAVEGIARKITPPPSLAAVTDGDEAAGLLTSNVGTIGGGIFVSQRPTTAAAEVDIRLPPGATLAEIERDVAQAVSGIPGLAWTRTRGWEANWTDPAHPFAQRFCDVVAKVRGEPPVPAIRLPASDASRWRARGIPALCYGPQPTLSAGVDDYVFEQEVVDCAKVYAGVALEFLS